MPPGPLRTAQKKIRGGGVYLTLARRASDFFRCTLTGERALKRTLVRHASVFSAYIYDRTLQRTLAICANDILHDIHSILGIGLNIEEIII